MFPKTWKIDLKKFHLKTEVPYKIYCWRGYKLKILHKIWKKHQKQIYFFDLEVYKHRTYTISLQY